MSHIMVMDDSHHEGKQERL